MAKKAPNKQTQSKTLPNEAVLRSTPWVTFLTDVTCVIKVMDDDGKPCKVFIPLTEQRDDMKPPQFKRRVHAKGSKRQLSRLMADGLGLVHGEHYEMADNNPLAEKGAE